MYPSLKILSCWEENQELRRMLFLWNSRHQANSFSCKFRPAGSEGGQELSSFRGYRAKRFREELALEEQARSSCLSNSSWVLPMVSRECWRKLRRHCFEDAPDASAERTVDNMDIQAKPLVAPCMPYDIEQRPYYRGWRNAHEFMLCLFERFSRTL